MPPGSRFAAAALSALIPLAGAAQLVPAPDGNDSSSGLVFGPKLLYYPMECQEPDGCQIECFQNGISVVNRTEIGIQDEVRLVVNAGISDEILPRWIEIKPVDGERIQTILLTRQTLCNFRSLLIHPRNQP